MPVFNASKTQATSNQAVTLQLLISALIYFTALLDFPGPQRAVR